MTARTVLTGVNKIAFAYTVKPWDNLKVKNASVKSCVLCRWIHHFKTCYWRLYWKQCRTLAHWCIQIPRLFHCKVPFHAVLSPKGSVTTGSITITVRRHFSHKGGRYFIWQLSVAISFRLSYLITCNVWRSCTALVIGEEAAGSDDTRQISYSFCTKNVHLKFSVVWWAELMHFLLTFRPLMSSIVDVPHR